MGEIIMTTLFDVVKSFMEEDDWPHQQLDDHPVLRTGFSSDAGQWTCYAHVREEREQLVFYSVFPFAIPAEKRPAMAELITRANYGLLLGNFEMDFEDGDLRYKTSLDVEGAELTSALVSSILYANVLTMSQYFPAIMNVLYSDTSPAEAITKIENE
jgi:hypothetical protein